MMFGIEKKHFFQLSNLLSLSRLFGSFPLIYFLVNPDILGRPITVVLVLLISITDFFDGYFARKFNQVSELGKILDPLADKVLVISVSITFYITGILDPTQFFVIVARDLMIMLPGLFLSKKIGNVPPSDWLGKWTFFFIGSYLILVFLQLQESLLFMRIYYYSLIVLIVASYFNYVIKAIKIIKSKK